MNAWAHPSGLAGHLAGIEMSFGKRRAVAAALDLLQAGAGARVIEVGCGPGVALRAIADAGAEATGIDPSRVMLAQARRRNRRAIAAGSVRLLAGRAEALPVADAAFTHYLSMYSAAFWDSLDDGLREARRALGGGGRLVIVARPPLPARVAQAVRPAGFRVVTATAGCVAAERIS